MPRYKTLETGPVFIAVDLAEQFLPGTLEHALNHLFDHELDLAHFDARYRNDDTGAPAYPPAMLLKVILYAYANRILSSRAIAHACETHSIFIALSGHTQPHFTTFAHFISHLGDDIAAVFGAVLALCHREGLIGADAFAIDGVKLPSNASKHRSGTRADFERQADKMERLARQLLERHREADSSEVEPPAVTDHRRAKVERLHQGAAELRDWLARNPNDRLGTSGKPILSNRTDNESAKLATDKGVIQGYTGVAAVDTRHQIIVAAQAHGTGAEQALLIGMVDATAPFRRHDTLITADAGYHSKDNLIALDRLEVNALIADNQMRKRDERLEGQDHHRAKPDPLYDKAGANRTPQPRYTPADFIYDHNAGTCTCPAGKHLYRHGANCHINGRVAVRFEGAKRDCLPCDHRQRCLRTPDRTATRQVAFFSAHTETRADRLAAAMKTRIDSEVGRALYGQRFATVEPVFGNLRANKRLDRFTLRGRSKVNAQWLMFCLVHNIEKLMGIAYARWPA
jgi:transposase